MFRESFILQNKLGEKIYGDIRYREDSRNVPGIVILHGFKGFKDWGFFPDLSVRLAESGYVAISFNFSRNGIGADPKKFTELEKFSENTISQELDDVDTVLAAIAEGELAPKAIDRERLGLIGHSRGGGVGIIAAAEHDEAIQCLVTWATVATFERFTAAQIDQWEKQGYIEIENVRTGQLMPVKKTFWDDLKQNADRFNLEHAAAALAAPSLFLHGDDDRSVPMSESERMYTHCGAAAKHIEIIEHADHTFGIQHPMENSTPAYETAADLTENWLDNYLRF